MKRVLRLGDTEHQIEILSPAPSCRFRLDGGNEQLAHVETPALGVYFILLDGRAFEAHVEETSAGLEVEIGGYRFAIEVRDPRRWNRNASSAGAEGIQTIRSPMPGKLVRVLVGAGAAVAAGQGIVVVEAMKMQNEIKAPRAGRVLRVTAVEGSTVAAGEILAAIE